MERKDIEIMAPAGSWESLAAALAAGADAVYFGAGRLNMRARSAAAFSLEDLPRLARAAADGGAKSCLTVNVVLYDEDLEELRRTVDAAAEAGISALILHDLAAMEYAGSAGMEVHLSTQANVSNLEALRFYSRWADTVVLARELSLDQIGRIHRNVLAQDLRGPSGRPVRLEAFVHGALCMAVSGKCYLSLHRYGAAANRGECLQNCRRAYRLVDPADGHELEREEDYFLSPKDLKTIGFLDRILGAGVRVLKIEGRARSADYVRAATACYGEALAAVLDGRYAEARAAGTLMELTADWDRRLGEVFNRGFWDGWYLGAQLGERASCYGSEAAVVKVLLGVCVNHYPKAAVAEFLLESGALSAGDEILVTGRTTGALRCAASELRRDGTPCARAEKGDTVTVPVPEKVRPGDKLYRLESRGGA